MLAPALRADPARGARAQVVLADGSLVRTAQRARKSTAGYDLTSLFVGSEGTLGVVVEATLRLQPVPEHSAVAVCAFPGVDSACKAVSDLSRQGVQVQCVELLDADMMQCVRPSGRPLTLCLAGIPAPHACPRPCLGRSAVNQNSGLDYPRRPHLFFKFSGTRAQVEDSAQCEPCGSRGPAPRRAGRRHDPAVQARAGGGQGPRRRRLRVGDGGGGEGATVGGTQGTCTPASRAHMPYSSAHRALRPLTGLGGASYALQVALWAAGNMRAGAKVWTTDVCVPISKLASCVADTQRDIASSPLQAPMVGHVGDGAPHRVRPSSQGSRSDPAAVASFPPPPMHRQLSRLLPGGHAGPVGDAGGDPIEPAHGGARHCDGRHLHGGAWRRGREKGASQALGAGRGAQDLMTMHAPPVRSSLRRSWVSPTWP